MNHRDESGKFVSKQHVRERAARHYAAFDDTPAHMKLLGLNYWPELNTSGLLIEPTVVAAYGEGREMANEIAHIRAFDFFQQLLIVSLGLYVLASSDLRIADLYKQIPRNWGEVIIGLATLVVLYGKCLWRGGQLRKRHDTFVRALGLPTRDAVTQAS